MPRRCPTSEQVMGREQQKKKKLFIFIQCSNRLSNALRTPCGMSTYLWLAELGLASTKQPVRSPRNPKPSQERIRGEHHLRKLIEERVIPAQPSCPASSQVFPPAFGLLGRSALHLSAWGCGLTATQNLISSPISV